MLQTIARQFRYFSTTPSKAQNLISDVLVEIFFLCVAQDDYSKVQGISDSLYISQVCQSWRAAALSCPRLWSRLHAQLEADGKTFQRLIPAIKCWLPRSGDASISVKVEQARNAVTAVELLDVVLAEFAQCSDRIERIAFVLPEHLCDEALSFVEKCERKLRSLSLNLYMAGYHSNTLLSHTNALRTVLSQLKTLEIKGSWPSTLDAVENFPSLTKLDLSAYRHPESLAQFLEKCPSLAELRYEVYTDVLWSLPAHPIHSQPIRTLPSIRLLNLRAGGRFSDSIHDFIDGLRMPNLYRLDIDYGDSVDCDFREDWRGLVRFLEVSSPPLESLYLSNCSFPARAITACLCLLPNLKNLRCRVSKQVARALDISRHIAGRLALCPGLERMVLDTPVLARADAETLAAVLEEVVCSRCALTTRPPGCFGLRQLDLPNEFLLRTRFTERLGVKECVALGLIVGASDSRSQARALVIL